MRQEAKNYADENYLSLVEEILEKGEVKDDRTGTGTTSVFGMQRRYDLREGFPLLTSKKINFNNILAELLWFLSASTNINQPLERLQGKSLHEWTRIWDDWADESGELGPIYAHQWIKWPAIRSNEDGSLRIEEVNQLQKAIDTIKNNPKSRRIIVSAWNAGEIENMALPPCHAFYQFNVSGKFVDLQLYQRSADVALGVPYNIASYALLLMMVAKECGLTARHFVHTTGDTHIYSNHHEGLEKQLARETHALPTVTIADKPFWDLTMDDFELQNYEHGKFIKFPIAV